MRQNVKDFASIVSSTLPIVEPVYEFGSFQVPEQVGFADLRPLFPEKEYVGCDMREGPGVDKVLNLHDIDLPSESVGTVLCFDTLEHVERPRRAMEEIHRVLKPNGFAVISSVMDFPIHDHPYDYWRFTPEAFKSILKPFAKSFVGFQGKEDFPHTIVGVGFRSDNPSLTGLTNEYVAWQKADRNSIRQMVLQLAPPIIVPLMASAYRTIAGLTRRST